MRNCSIKDWLGRAQRRFNGTAAADCQGFSLLEVMVATALMALVLVALLQVLTGAMRAQETTLEHAQAIRLAERLLQERCNAMDLSATHRQGDEGHFSYVVRVTPQYEVSERTLDRQVRCSMIQVQVSWKERDQQRSLTLETMRTASQRRM